MSISATLHLHGPADVTFSGLHEGQPGGWVSFAEGVWPQGMVNIHATDLRHLVALGQRIAAEAGRLMAAERPACVAAEDQS